jgi:hypothetical protein
MACHEYPTDLRHRIDYVNQLNSQLIQRVNYFLVGIAFLVTAFVALVTSQSFHNNPYFISLAVLISGTGCLLSLIFTVMNYNDSKRYKRFADKLYDLPVDNYLTWVKELWNKKDEGKEQDTELHVPHVFLVPLMFTIFWLLVTSGISYYVGYDCNSRSGCFRGILLLVCGLIMVSTAATIVTIAFQNTYQVKLRCWMISIIIVFIFIFVAYLITYICAINCIAKTFY